MKKIFFVIIFFLIVLFACPTSKSSSNKTADSKTDTTETVVEEEPKEAKEEKKEEPKAVKNEGPQYTEYVVSTNGGRLNVRKEPNKSADIITKLENGKTVKVISSENGWAKVSTDSGEGYVSLDYLALNNNDQKSSAEAASKSVKEDSKEEVKKEEVKEVLSEETWETYTVTTSGSTLNVRSGPGQSYPVITKLGYGKTVQVADISNGWAKVKTEKGIGYASSKYLTKGIVEVRQVSTESEKMTFIINRNNKKVHVPGCRAISQMKEKNKKEVYTTVESLIRQGYKPCALCDPW